MSNPDLRKSSIIKKLNRNSILFELLQDISNITGICFTDIEEILDTLFEISINDINWTKITQKEIERLKLENIGNFASLKRSNFKKLLKKRVFPKIQKLYASIGPREKYIVGLLALIIFGSALAIGVQLYLSNTKAQPKEGGEYREALIGLPRFLNPALSTTNDVDRDLTQLLYSSLVKYDQNGNIIPDLAETFEILDEGKEYRFTLKRNLFWEDGKPLTAQDVLFTIQLIQNSQYSSSLYQSWQGVNVSIENENIIVFKLSNAYPPFLENATVGILPSHIWEKVTAQNFTLSELNLRPIGSGPFKVEKFTRDNSGLTSSYTLQKNDNYHGKKP